MFFDLSRGKLVMLFIIIILFLASIGFFLYLNGSWALIARIEENMSMTRSQIWFWLLYKLSPESAARSAANNNLNISNVARSIPALLYHGEGAGTDMPTAVFVDQMQALKQAGWHTTTMQEFDAWEKGIRELPDKSFLLTFDDGRKDTYYQADPVLKDVGFHAIMFVITGFSLPNSGKNPNFYLNRTELADMIKSGRWELESHGKEDHGLYAVQSTTDLEHSASSTPGHYLSNKFWSVSAHRFETDAEFTARVQGDMRASKEALESEFGRSVIAFAFPFNDFGQSSINFDGARAIIDRITPRIYTYAFYQTWPGNGAFNYPHMGSTPGSTSFMIRRFEPKPQWSGQDLLDILNAGRARNVPYRSSQLGNEWSGTWGNIAYESGAIALSGNSQTTGASVFLNGSAWWSDYLFTALLDWQRGETLSLLARVDNQNYISCAFSGTRVIIAWHNDGASQETITAKEYQFQGSPHDAHLGIGVALNRVTCYEEGTAVVSGVSRYMTRNGGIGVEVWDKTPGIAKSVLKSVDIQLLRGVQMQATSTP